MTYKEYNLLDKCLEIINYYGVEPQQKIAIEEMAELTQAIIKLERNTEYIKYKNNYIEELADCYLILLQLIMKSDIKKIYDIAIKKANRQLKRIKDENKNHGGL